MIRSRPRNYSEQTMPCAAPKRCSLIWPDIPEALPDSVEIPTNGANLTIQLGTYYLPNIQISSGAKPRKSFSVSIFHNAWNERLDFLFDSKPL